MKLNVGDVVKLKKKHPCGGDDWEILRIGADFRIKCTTCKRQVWLRERSRRRITKLYIKLKMKLLTSKNIDSQVKYNNIS